MDWKDFRLSSRLTLKPDVIEEVYAILSEIDSVKNSWKLTGKLLPQMVEKLTHSVLITSTGASNRIEGNLLTDDQVQELYKNMRVKKFKSRDEQEVAGYIEMLELVFDNYESMPITESTILQLHNEMLSHSEKDLRHKGHYKFGSNRVEAKDPSGNVVGVVFDPTPPFLTPKEMQELTDWYKWAVDNNFKHPLILLANFIFEYLAIHPFQDGNGRTSRLLTNLGLMRNGYEFACVVSHEKIVEANKADYYLALNKTQKTWNTEQEDISIWLLFFLKVLRIQAGEALRILEGENIEYLLSDKQLVLWRWVNKLPSSATFTRKDAINATQFPPRTVESIIVKLLELKKLEMLGQGRSTRYRVL